MPLLNDGVSTALERAMDGVAFRQRVISQNMANAMTPGYTAQRVDFEGALADAVRSGQDLDSFTPQATATGEPAGLDGNNVRLEAESSALMRSGLQFDALVQAANYKHNVLRTAVRGH